MRVDLEAEKIRRRQLESTMVSVQREMAHCTFRPVRDGLLDSGARCVIVLSSPRALPLLAHMSAPSASPNTHDPPLLSLRTRQEFP